MAPTEHFRVLLIEDNEIDARALTKMLSGPANYDVERASDLSSGIAAIDAQIYDCILLDLSLPDSDGLVSVETVVARSPLCPVVVLTGLDDPEVAVEAVGRGAQDYLVKDSISSELLRRAIRYAITRHSTETELHEVHDRLSELSSREQIARDLHDTVIQRLFATGMSLQAASSLRSRDDMAGRMMLAIDEIDDAIRQLRQAIFGLNTVHDEETLAYELARLADSYSETLGFDPVVRLGDIPPVSSALHNDVLATVREALANVAKHAGATAVTVSVFVEGDDLIARVSDNGRGVSAHLSPTDDGLSGNGLKNMAARAEAHRGTLQVDATPSGGTELTWSARLAVR